MGLGWRVMAMAGVAAALAGCTLLQTEPPPEDALAVATRSCLAGNKRFIDAWGCIQSRDALDQTGGDTARRKHLMKLGDDLASEVTAKKLSDAEAKTRLSKSLSAVGDL